MTEILTLSELKQALRLDNSYLDSDIQSSLDAAMAMLQKNVGYADDYVPTPQFTALAKNWLKEYVKSTGSAGGGAYFPDYDNSAGLNTMADALQDIYAERGTI